MKKYIFKYAILLLVVVLVPSITNAANVYFETTKDAVSVGDTFIISAKIDALNTSINSIEGDFIFESNNENLIVNDFSLAKSIFSLWPQTPSLSDDGNTISFVGGVPGGFNLDDSILFNIIVEANKEGSIKLSPKDIIIFANDGIGTKVPVSISSLEIDVLPKNDNITPVNEWSDLVLNDKIAPEKFDIVIGKESTLFEGKRFAFFTAVDNQSGISYYEVSENGKPSIRSGSTYVLENQDAKMKPNLVVIAYDKAGNKTISVYQNQGPSIFGLSYRLVIIIVFIILVSLFIIKIIKMKRKNNVQKI